MNTLKENLNKLTKIRDNIITIIKNKGVEITDNILLQDLVPVVRSLGTTKGILTAFLDDRKRYIKQKIIFDDTFTEIGDYAFYDLQISKPIIFEGNLTSISSKAFTNLLVPEIYLKQMIKGSLQGEPWGADSSIIIHYKTFSVNFNVNVDNAKIMIQDVGEVTYKYNTEETELGNYIVYKEGYLINTGFIGDTISNKTIDINMTANTTTNKNSFKLVNTNSLQTVDFEITINGCTLNFKQYNQVTLYFDKQSYDISYKITAPLGYKDQQGKVTLTSDHINNFTLEEGTNYTIPQQGNRYYISNTPELKRYILSEGYGLTINDYYIEGNNDYYGVVAFNNPFDTTKLYCDITGYNGVSGMYIGSKPYKPTKEQLKNKQTDGKGTWLWTSDEGNKLVEATIPTGDCFVCLVGYGEELLTSYAGLYLL